MATTLADFLGKNLSIVSVGINPSPASVIKGYPFASPQNRFWAALNQSDLVSQGRSPSIETMHELVEVEGIGFTDIVKRPTRSANDLRSADFRLGTNALVKKLASVNPAIVWFQGMLAARAFFRYAAAVSKIKPVWGEQELGEFPFGIFVSPNPSSANAAYSLSDLIDFFNQLALYRNSNTAIKQPGNSATSEGQP
ncbi:MAG: mismatch-specific DNA-glycosylase [Gammaproteobacteria bacterium]